MSWVTELARPDIVALKAYEHAVWEPSLERLHANELPWRGFTDPSLAGLNRYPEPQPAQLVRRLAALYDVSPKTVLVGRGSDEAIDLLVRGFCRAERDSVIVCPPTFGMYAVAARIQGANVVTVPLLAERGFALDEEAILARCTPDVKLIFFCSPNNPTANSLDEAAILRISAQVAGRAIVVVDEAYIEFSGAASLARHLASVPHLAILRTLSKAYALAGARCGTLIADPEVVALLRKVIPPYAVAQLTTEAVLKALEPGQLQTTAAHLDAIRSERGRLLTELPKLQSVVRVWPSTANFVLAEFTDAGDALTRARHARLLIRDVRGYPGLGRHLRISVGTAEQNTRLLEALR
ncbi:MAG TPA: histidinol-phosphate transaminase [Steroidobacteraceae bacterium]|nr:histidinol-phosphate transaminase [Steroidobacteraceae bacterium]